MCVCVRGGVGVCVCPLCKEEREREILKLHILFNREMNYVCMKMLLLSLV